MDQAEEPKIVVLSLGFFSISLVFNRRTKKLQVIRTHQDPANSDEPAETLLEELGEDKKGDAYRVYLESMRSAIDVTDEFVVEPKNGSS